MKTSIHILIGLIIFFSVLLGCKKKEIYGCTSPTAKNYSSNATSDDGSCFEPKTAFFESEFLIDFGQSGPVLLKIPEYNGAVFEKGDVLVCKYNIPSQTDGWLEFPFVSQSMLIQTYYHEYNGEIVFEVKQPDGSFYTFQSSFPVKVRVKLLKKH